MSVTDGWWDELAVAALLGTDRRPELKIGSLPAELAAPAARLTGDPAAILLDVAALAVAYRRGGAPPEHLAGEPPRAPAEPSGRPTARAAALLAELLDRKTELVRYWCEAAAGAGLVAPEAQLPALLDLASAQRALRPAIVSVLGQRGRWLAQLQPGWAALAAQASPSPGVAVDPQVWEFADPADELRPLGGDLELVVRYLTAAPSPWPEPVAEAALGWLVARLPELSPLAPRARPLLRLIADRFPLARGAEAVLAAADSAPDDLWRQRLTSVAADIALRARIHQELQ